jgi:hypothetical protein
MSKKTQQLSITNISWLMLSKERVRGRFQVLTAAANNDTAQLYIPEGFHLRNYPCLH